MNKADLLDNVLAPGGIVGKRTPKWPDSYDHAAKRMRLGGSLTILKDASGAVLRYTIHVAGYPSVLSDDFGQRLMTELPMRECWSMAGNYGAITFDGTFTLYQVKNELATADSTNADR